MSAGSYDLYIEQGATLSLPIIWKDSDGNVINITGYTARMQVRQTRPSTTVLLSATTENGKLVIDGSNGKVTISLSATDTSAITWLTGVYDLELISGSGVVTRLIEGSVTVSQEVTR
jgi:hypothetical protein